MSKTCAKRLIVNADDYGFSPGVTEGILQAHHGGIVTSTTLAANMPCAGEAVRRLSEAPCLGVGVHLNISQGPALSDEARSALAGPDGLMNRTAAGLIRDCLLNPRLLDAFEAEFDAQIRWALDHGLKPTHLDTHRHTHAFAPIFIRVARLARRYSIPHVRRHREPAALLARGVCVKQSCVSAAINVMARANRLLGRGLCPTRGTWGVAATGEINAPWLIMALGMLKPGATEIMTHPGVGDDLEPGATRLRQCRQNELDALCDARVKEAVKRNEVELTHYGSM